MKKVIAMILAVLLVLSLTACGGTAPETPSSTGKPLAAETPPPTESSAAAQAPVTDSDPAPANPGQIPPETAALSGSAPVLLPLRVEPAYDMDEVNGRWISTDYPVYSLSRSTLEGETECPAGYERLDHAIVNHNGDLTAEAGAAYTRMWNQAMTGSGEGLIWDRAAAITRCDSACVSFYERAEYLEGEGLAELDCYNYDPGTGELLRWSDVFTDADAMPDLLDRAFRSAYAGLEFYEDSRFLIASSVQRGDGAVGFALSEGLVHFFIEPCVVSDMNLLLHITMSLAESGELVKPAFCRTPERWMLPLDYDVTYNFSQLSLSMAFYEAPDSADMTWLLRVDGQEYTEEFYGYAPKCHLVHTAEGWFLYLRVPVGDVSSLMKVYALGPRGVQDLGMLELAFDPAYGLDPDRMRMSLNDWLWTEDFWFYVSGEYRVGADGRPVANGAVFALNGPELELREGGRYNAPTREEAAVSGGMWTLVAGQRLRPLRTDRASYLDFRTDDGRIVRFSVNRFDSDMVLDDWGGLSEVFALPAS